MQIAIILGLMLLFLGGALLVAEWLGGRALRSDDLHEDAAGDDGDPLDRMG